MKPDGEFQNLTKYRFYDFFTTNNEMKKYSSGFLLKDIFDRLNNKTKCTLNPDRTLWLYFAHDITISKLLGSLGIDKVIFCLHLSLGLS